MKEIAKFKDQELELGIGSDLWVNATQLEKQLPLRLQTYSRQPRVISLIERSELKPLEVKESGVVWLPEKIALDYVKSSGDAKDYTQFKEVILANKPINPRLDNNEGRVTVSSLDVADKFIKDHKNVIRDIEALECSLDFKRLNFEPSNYVDSQGVTQPCYAMTRDGFSFLVMGFTGKMAARFKEAYINEFNRMEGLSKSALPKDYPSALRALADSHEARMIAEAAAEQNKEKAEGYELLIEKADNYSLKEAADLLGSGQNRFSKWLKTKSYLQLDGIPYQTYLRNQPYFVVKETTRHGQVYHTPMITPKGMDHFTKLRNKGEMEKILNFPSKTLDT